MDNTLLRYLMEVCKMERQLYAQNSVFNQLRATGHKIGVAKNIQPPPSVDSDKHRDNWRAFGWLITLFLLIPFEVGFFCAILDEFTKLGGFSIFLLGGLSFFVFFAVDMWLLYKRAYKKDKRESDEINLDRLAEYWLQVSNDGKRIEKEKIYGEEIKKQAKTVWLETQKTIQALEELYGLNLVHPKYRNYIAISSFCEYFETGRCSKLEGHDGAYNIFEQEIRLNQIVTKLDDIANKLDDIKTHQYYLYQGLMQTNKTLTAIEQHNKKMLTSLDEIRQNVALTEFNTRCAAANTEAIGNMIVFREIWNA